MIGSYSEENRTSRTNRVRKMAMNEQSFEQLQKILIDERELELARVRHAIEAKAHGDVDPGDQLDFVQSLRSAEFDARISERHNLRLAAIEESLKRLQHGAYGICQECEDQIALDRLRALPFATRCQDCQAEREKRALSHRIAHESFLGASQFDEELGG